LMDRILPLVRRSAGVKRSMRSLLERLPWHRAKLLAGALGSRDPVELFNYLRGTGKDYPTLLSSDLDSPEPVSRGWFEQFAAGFAIDLGGADTAMRLDAGFTLPDLFLQKVDVATMAFSLEARCPMTDYRVVEWAMRLPIEFKLRGGESKYLLKKALRRYLPHNQVYRPKMGFGVPIAAWLRGPLRPWMEALIHDDALMSRLPLDCLRVRELMRQQLNGERESHPLLWSVLMLLCFVQRHGARQPLPATTYREVA
jgi:asparagine synthase (glutamine-hydrolysing)